jgi:SAM-dependent methyltransferase
MQRDDTGVIGLYTRHGLAWATDRAREPWFEGGWMARFLALLPARAALLDLGCGAGVPIAAHLVARGHAVTGVDASAPLLELFRRNCPGQPAVLADMRGLALGRVFQGILAWDSLFHLAAEDQRGIFATFRAHAAPGAALIFTSGPRAGIAMGRYAGEALFHASLDPEAYRALLDEAGFEVIAHRAEDPDCGGRTVWLARQR